MNLQELTAAMHEFVRAKGWYEPGSPRQQTLRNLAISLCLEAGEVLEHFQWHEQLEHPHELASELADVPCTCCKSPASPASTWNRLSWTN